MTPVIIQSKFLLPTKACARSTILFPFFLGEDADEEEGDDEDDVCPNSGSRDVEFFFLIELSATFHAQFL